MDKIRRYLWEQFGVTLDRETKIVGSIVVMCVIAAVVFSILFAFIHASFFLLMVVLTTAGAGTVAFGGSYDAMAWGLASKARATSSQNARKPSLRATKSVSQLISTRMPARAPG